MAWNRPRERDQGSEIRDQGTRKFPFRGLVAGVIVVLGSAVAAWWLWPTQERGEDAASTTSTSRIREVAPAAAPKPQEEVAKPAKPKLESSMWVRTEKLPNGDEKRWTANGESYYVDMRRSRIDGKTIFTNDIENILAMYIRPGEDMPPPPTDEISDEEALAACNIPLYAYCDDPNEVLDQREAVDYLKKELKQWLEDGGHATDYLKELMHRQESEAEYVRMTRDEVMKLIREDDGVIAAQLLSRMNQKLAEKGIPPVRLSPDYQEAMDYALEQERKDKNGKD